MEYLVDYASPETRAAGETADRARELGTKTARRQRAARQRDLHASGCERRFEQRRDAAATLYF